MVKVKINAVFQGATFQYDSKVFCPIISYLEFLRKIMREHIYSLDYSFQSCFDILKIRKYQKDKQLYTYRFDNLDEIDQFPKKHTIIDSPL